MLWAWPALDRNKWGKDANLTDRPFLMSPFTSKCDDGMGTKPAKFVFHKLQGELKTIAQRNTVCPSY